MVCVTAGEQEVRFLVTLRCRAPGEAELPRPENRLQMVFKALSGPALAPVLDGQAERDEAVDVGVPA